jgi:lysophospholipase L1-like esterase
LETCVGTADGFSQTLPVRVALLALSGMAALQAIYFLLAADGPTRVVGTVLGVGSILLRSWSGSDRSRQLAAQTALAVAICGNIAAHYRTLSEPIDARVLLVAVMLGYLGLLVAGAAALVRTSLFLPLLLSMFSFGVAMLVAEVILEPPWQRDEPPPDLSWRGVSQHPDTSLHEFYRPRSQIIHPYPSDPRGYFERLDPLEIRWSLTVSDTSAKAALVRDADHPGVLRVEISSAPTRTAWHIQLAETGLSVTRGDRLAVRFRARADQPRSIGVALTRGRAPWSTLGFKDTITIDTVWRDFDIPVVATATYPWGRLQFDLGAESPSVELSGIALVNVASGDTIMSNFPHYAVRYSFNDMGCRDRDFPLERAAGTWRILALGDSYTMGVGVHARDVFTARLEQLLNGARSPGSPRYEVINCGVSGYSTEDELILYERHVARYNPDLVLLTMVWNDDRSYRDEVRMGFHEQTRHRLFQTWRLLDKTLADRRLHHHDYSNAMRALDGLRKAVEARGSRLAVIIARNNAGHEWDELADAVYGSVDTLALPVLDLWGRLRTEPSREITVLEGLDGHPNERAHAIMAGEIARFLDQKGLLPPRGNPAP